MASRRIELGFDGGVLRLTVDESQIAPLTAALGGEGIHHVEAEEGEHWIRLTDVRYLRAVPGDATGRVGFANG